jgi:Mg-chelatase subunit ChlD
MSTTPRAKTTLRAVALIIWLLSVGVCVAHGQPREVRKSPLIGLGEDGGQRIPLILIHGIHGTAHKADRYVLGDYWRPFLAHFEREGGDIRARYAVYVFQYHSDRDTVLDIANELGASIDERLTDRPHVILAHSMGGLVAKAYMVYFRHRKGVWANTTGGDSTLGLITLATPHHGTPGANDPDALKSHMGLGWRQVFESMNFLYWTESAGFFSPPALQSRAPNRGDLLWDNYDGAIPSDAPAKDHVNIWLSHANRRFTVYAPKVIAYAGALKPVLPNLTSAGAVAQALNVIMGNRGVGPLRGYNDHQRLEFANETMVYGLSDRFGITDGLVPYRSALLCNPPTPVYTTPNSNYFCDSPLRVRRFEPGLHAEKPTLPANTLSITRRARGYDHKDMLEHGDVLRLVVEDLGAFAPPTPKPVQVPGFPTLFLIDTSGSMSENGKIEQARGAALDALEEIRAGVRQGVSVPPLAVLSFAGPCSPSSTRKLLDFTNNLEQAETIMRQRLPRPEGETPSPQAIEAAVRDLNAYLSQHMEAAEGRIILLSDGQSTCGEVRPAGVYSQRVDIAVGLGGARSPYGARIRFLTIGFNVPPGSAAERDLQYLASISGGKYFNAPDRRQLTRIFQKFIRVFVPKSLAGPTVTDARARVEFEQGLRALLARDYKAALKSFRAFVALAPSHPSGLFNLALALEATDHYKGAVEFYRRYLEAAPNAPDRAEIERRIEQLRQDYIDQFNYYVALMRSDLAYLKNYYQTLFNRRNDELAREFAGFVSEKGGFYASLPDILEIDARWLTVASRDLTDSLNMLAARIRLPTFDRDAVSLLTLPIGQLEEIIERAERHAAQLVLVRENL